MCGCDDAEKLWRTWARKESPWLSKFLLLPHGTPTQDVFLRVLAAIKPEEFRRAFTAWVRDVLAGFGVCGQIAVDGQTNRGSRDRSTQRSPVHMVSALACGEGLVLGQLKTDDKSNEITAILALLSLLDLRGALVSIDAMGCQVATAKLIRDGSGDYLLGLKGNQTTLRDETEAVFEAAQRPASVNVDVARPLAIAQATTTDKGHGRLETRTAKVMSDFHEWGPAAERWPDLNSSYRHRIRARGYPFGQEHGRDSILHFEPANESGASFELCARSLAGRERPSLVPGCHFRTGREPNSYAVCGRESRGREALRPQSHSALCR